MKRQTTNYKLQTNIGFSLLETIVAISILMTTIIGPLSLASKGIVSADYVKDEITGFYLAQEAMETVRNVRDTNIKNRVSWLNGIKEYCIDKTVCRIDIWNFDRPDHGFGSCVSCVGGEMERFERLKIANVVDRRGATRLYGHVFNGKILAAQRGDLEDSIFSRKITIKKIEYSDPKFGLTPLELKSLGLDKSGIDEINVTVEVSWFRGSSNGNLGKRTVRVSESMFSL